MKLKDIDIHAIGNTIQITGAIFSGEEQMFLCMFPKDGGDIYSGPTPGEYPEFTELGTEEVFTVDVLDMDLDDWNTFLRQTDILEVEILQQASDGKLAKAVLRKSARQISQHVSWAVFRRDHYRCRYCGRADVPLTVDHLVLWEEGGPSIDENLVAACKKCNKSRGNMEYADWLESPYYKKVSENLDSSVRFDNQAMVGSLDSIPRLHHKRSRR